MRLKTVTAADIKENSFYSQRKRKREDKSSSKGLTSIGITPGFIVIAIIGITVFSFFYWNKLGYSKELIARTAADRLTRSIKLVSTYRGQGSLVISFRRSYKFDVAGDRVIATFKGRNSTSYFFTDSQVEPPPTRNETKSVNISKRGKGDKITIDYPG